MSEGSEHDKDVQRKRERRSKAAEVYIPPVADQKRRDACLADPVLFLKTYGESTFYNEFAEHHLAMIDAIHQRAITGGDQAIAAPRGDGKTQVATWMTVYILLAKLVRFPVIIAATRKHAQKIFKQIKYILGENVMLGDDFPEISACVRELAGAPQRAAKQHVDGERTRIIWTQDEIGLPHVPGSDYGGRYLAYYGLDTAIRGVHFNGVRPDFALIDDPETRDVAKGEQHWNVEQTIDSDVAGLAGPDSTISRVVLTTIQNRRCYSFRVTDPATKPAFNGKRYGVLAAWPTNQELWQEYVALRQKDQAEGDKDGHTATQFYLDNRESMDAGAVVSNPNRFNQRLDASGNTVEVSALQAFYNRIADWGLARVLAELQNDPEPEESAETLGLTAGLVATRMNGLMQNELPREEGVRITVGLDIGKYYSHWTKIAWFGNATGCILDYGVMETPGMQASTDSHAVELALLSSLLNWRSDIISVNPPDFCLVDAGDYSDAVYEFVRRVGGNPFAASKGWDAGRFQMGSETATRRLFDNCWAGHQSQQRLWLYNVNTEHWKGWVHERFITSTFNDAHHFNDGSLSLFSDTDAKRHLSFSHHIVAEMREDLFVEGKGMVRKWRQRNKNNHWLDATALACAAAGVIGVRLIPSAILPVQPPKPATAAKQIAQHNQRLRQRAGGWIQGARGRKF